MNTLLLYSLFFLPITHAGVLVGNDGGDSVFCKRIEQPSRFIYDGFYVLDYAVAFPAPEFLARVNSVTEGLDRVERLLGEKAPAQLASFQSFRATLDPAPFMDTEKRIWRASERPLQNIQDEFVRMLPPNCRLKNIAQKEYSLYKQTVIRRQLNTGVIRYEYDPSFVGEYLSRQDPTQALVLFLHEWLWDFYEKDKLGAPRIRAANAFLNSVEAEEADPITFHRRLFKATPQH